MANDNASDPTKKPKMETSPDIDDDLVRRDSTRWELAARTFRAAPRITLPPAAEHSSLSHTATLFDGYMLRREDVPFPEVPVRYLRRLRHHDCIWYNVAGVHHYEIWDIFDELWRIFYPRRNLRWATDGWSWFCSPFKVCRPASEGDDKKERGTVDPSAILDLHEVLLGMADAAADQIEAKQGVAMQIEESMREIFLVLDKEDWRKDGFLAVCKLERASSHGLVDAEKVQEFRGWGTWRVPVDKAVQTVVTDEERLLARAPLKPGVIDYTIEKNL